MAVPTLKSITPTTNNTAGDPHRLAYPASSGIEVGDLLVSLFIAGISNQSDPYYTGAEDDGSTEWAEMGQITHINADTTVSGYWKIADEDDADGTVTGVTASPLTNVRKGGLLLVYSGHDPENPINAVAVSYDVNTDPNTIDGVTTDVDDCYVGAWHAMENGADFVGFDTAGWTKEAETFNSAHSYGYFYELTGGKATAGAVGQLDIDIASPEKSAQIMFAIAPISSGEVEYENVATVDADAHPMIIEKRSGDAEVATMDADTFAMTILGTPAGGLSASPGLVTEEETLFAVAATPGAVSIAPGLVSEGETLFSTTPSLGGSPQSVAPGLVTEEESLFSVAPSPGSVSVIPGLVTEEETLFSVAGADATSITISGIVGGASLSSLSYVVFDGANVGTASVVKQGNDEETDANGDLVIDISGLGISTGATLTVVITDYTIAPGGSNRAAVCYGVAA